MKIWAQTPPNPFLLATQLSQTPQNLEEAFSRSEYIKYRIYGQQGSFPKQNIFATKQLVNEALELACQTNLMLEEIRTLQKTNERLGKRLKTEKQKIAYALEEQ